MADKEATVFIIDLGKSMSRTRHGRTQSDLDWSLQYVWDKITNIVYMGRKTLFVGVIGLGTDETDNEMGIEEGYSNISCFQPLQAMGMPELRALAPKLTASTTEQRDALSAIIIAVDMITKHCKKLKYNKKIILVTNGTGEIDEDDITDVVSQIQDNDIKLTVLGVDFDDPEYGFKEEDKPPTKSRNERLFRRLVEQSGAKLDENYGTMQEAIEMLNVPFIKPVRPTPTYKGQLMLGDPTNYDTAIAIDIERYFKVSARRPPTASAHFVGGTNDTGDDEGLNKGENSRTYSIPDPDKPGDGIAISREDLAKGYEYGRTAVHISESDENITKLETEAGYHILGFVPRENIERYLLLDNTNMIVAQRSNDKAAIALSSVIHALVEIDSCAIARLVKKDMLDPQLTLLTPYVTAEIECLIENILPFAEDLRQYRFPPLDKVVTVSGKHLDSHRNLPSDDLMSAMSDFVDGMSLMDGDEDRMPIQDTYSPVNYAVERAIKYRAVHPDKEIPPIPETFLAYSQQPPDLQDQNRVSLSHLVKVADVKKVPPKVKGKRKYRDIEKPLSGLNVEDLFRKEKRTQISPENAISEFRQTLESSSTLHHIQNAVKQMEKIVKNRIKASFGDRYYDRVIEELGVMRESLLDFEEPDLYNDAIQRVKEDILGEKLNGNRMDLWRIIKRSKLGLIDHDQCEPSKVTKEQAHEFLHTPK